LDLNASADQSVGGNAHRFVPDEESDALPFAYGTDWLVLMVCDPWWAHAYWDLDAARVGRAIESLGGGTAFLRLLGVPDGVLLAEYQVSPQRGDYRVALPEAGRRYRAELAMLHYGRKALLARSDVVHAPPIVPAPASAPVFVTRAQQLRALAAGLTLQRTSDVPDPSAPGLTGLWAAMRRPFSLLPATSMGSEARLLAIESRLP